MEIQDYKEIGALVVQVLTILIIFWAKVRTGVGIKQLWQAFRKHTAKDDMKAKIHQRLEVVTIEKLRYVRHLNSQYRDMLMSWSDKFEDFAINAYFSEYRRSKDVELYLTSKAGSMIADIDLMLLQRRPEKKSELTIVNYAMQKTGFYKEIDLLVRALVNNGLDDTEYIDLFVDFVDRILNEGIKLFQKWNEQK